MEEKPKCLYCQQTSDATPLVNLTFKDRPLWICTQHLPMLIHESHKLAQQLSEAARSSSES